MRAVVFVAALACGSSAFAQGSVRVDGYTTKNGTYVAPHYRSAPDNTRSNNYGTQGNVNPYTGQQGTQPAQPSYGNPYGSGGNLNTYGTPRRN